MDSDYTPKEFSPFPNKELVDAERDEIRRQVRDSIDLLGEIVRHYDEALDAIRTKQTTPLELTLFPKRHAIHSRAEKRVQTFIENERAYIQALIDDYS